MEISIYYSIKGVNFTFFLHSFDAFAGTQWSMPMLKRSYCIIVTNVRSTFVFKALVFCRTKRKDNLRKGCSLRREVLGSTAQAVNNEVDEYISKGQINVFILGI